MVINFLKHQNHPVAASKILAETGKISRNFSQSQEKGLIIESSETVERVAYDDGFSDSNEKVEHSLVLTEEQSAAVRAATRDLQSSAFQTRLIYGVTGSGENRSLLEAMEEALNKEAAFFSSARSFLAPQTVSRIRNRFENEKVVVWHSHLSSGERVDAWRSITKQDSRIVVGARSAIFSPLPRLRLIIVDEEHEAAYKQEDNPRYHARDIAVLRAKFVNATCLLGSATPSLETMYNAKGENTV